LAEVAAKLAEHLVTVRREVVPDFVEVEVAVPA
jgi:hypothetical protein